MSMFNYYRSNALFDKFNVGIDNNSISTESVIDDAINIIKKIYERIKQFIKYISEKIMAGFKYILNFFKRNKKKDEVIFKTIIKEDLYKVYKDTLIGPNGRTKFFINQDGSIIDLDMMEKESTKIYDDLASTENKDFIMDPRDIVRDINRLYIGYEVNNESDVKKVKIDQLVNLINPGNISAYEKHIDALPKLIKSLNDENSALYKEYVVNERDSSDDDEDAKIKSVILSRGGRRLNTMMEIVRNKFQVYQSIVGFYRIVTSTLHKGFCFCDKVEKGTKLYHLSFNDKLVEENKGVLDPRYPISANFKNLDSVEIFPKRTSFSSKIEEAIYGVWSKVNENSNTEDGTLTVVVDVYEGLPDENTLRIKEKYAKESIYEYEQTKEIPVTTKIKIKYLGKYKLYFDATTPAKLRLPDGRLVTNGVKYLKQEKI